jgi:Ca2+-binding EF-hand superfamily protein
MNINAEIVELTQKKKFEKIDIKPKILEMVKSDNWNLPQIQSLRTFFGMMDKENKGYLHMHQIEQLLKKHGKEFNKRQTESFRKFAKISEG